MSKRRTFDVDIDVSPSTTKDRYGAKVGIYNEDKLKLVPHPSGICLDDHPVDPLTNLIPRDYAELEEAGFIKVDLLTNSSYKHFSSKKEVIEALKAIDSFDWSKFQNREFVESLPHLSKHFFIVSSISPQSVNDLADCIAIIRPGKIHLFDDYLDNKKLIRPQLYKRPTDGKMYFKKSHAIAYATMILVSVIGVKDKSSLFFD